jgi:hypothetical protein
MRMRRWRGWRQFAIMGINEEADGVRSFYVEPGDGQFLGTAGGRSVSDDQDKSSPTWCDLGVLAALPARSDRLKPRTGKFSLGPVRNRDSV